MKPVVRVIFQFCAFAALLALIVYLFPQSGSRTKFDYEVGKPWSYGLLMADYDFSLYKTDDQLLQDRKLALENFLPYYKMVNPLDTLCTYVVDYSELKRINEFGCSAIQVIANNIPDTVLVSQLHTPKSYYTKYRKDVSANVVFDSVKSGETIRFIEQNVSQTQGVVLKGAKIVDSGEIVTEEIYQQVFSLIKSWENKKVTENQMMISMLGRVVCVAMLLLLFYLYLYTFRRKLLDNLRHVLFFTILMALIISAAFVLLASINDPNFVYLIPFVWVPIIARVFYDSRTAIFLHIITVGIVSLALTSQYVFLLTQIAAGIVAVISLRDMTQRAQLAQTAAFVLLAYCVMYTALHLLTMWEFKSVDFKLYGLFFVNAILVICAYGLIFLFERSFGLVSSITLVELTNVNSNLMLQFAEKAPGTFQHSLQVSNLATEAAKRIGAKVLLVRTGALYHDIGKMSNAECFIENQSDGYNPLNGMGTADAAKLVINHVLEGERIARKHHLPELIVHFIRSHHGNSQTRYFYNTAINRAKQEGLDISTVNVADYTYPGPKPMTKEAAILMMADAIEARSRSLEVMTPQSISDMVDDMIDIQMRDGQLAETPLSFKDLEDIRLVFKQKLMEINHHRITYPTVE